MRRATASWILPLAPRPTPRAWVRASARTVLVALVVAANTARAQIAVLSRSTEEHEARPGEQYDLTLVIRNPTPRSQDVRIYQTDYQFFADGRSLFDAPGTVRRSNARWLSIESTRISIPAGATQTVPYRVRVPDSGEDSLSGSYWSVVMIEAAVKDTADSLAGDTGSARQRGDVAMVLRYGTQVVTHIAGTGAPAVEFTEAHVTEDSAATPALSIDIANTGTRARMLDISLELFTERGERVAKLTAKRGLVLPGTSIRQRFSLGKLAPGGYRALVVTDAGTETLFGAEYSFRM